MRNNGSRRFKIIIFVAVLAGAGLMAYGFLANKKLLSPVPPAPDFQIIYQTPVPTAEPASVSLTLTPKVRPSPTSVPPKPAVSAKPSVNISPAVKISTPSSARKTD